MSFHNPTKPASWQPLDDDDRDGRPALVLGEGFFATARWTPDGWIYSGSGIPLGFVPTECLRRERV